MEQKENKMGVMPVKRLIVTMSLPMMASMLVQALYNIVDSIFVSQISEAALSAVTLAFPMQNLMMSVASGTGVGINALLSRSLGEKHFATANKSANTGIMLGLLSYLVFLLVGIFLSGPFIRFQTDDPLIAEYGTTYLTICLVLSIGVFMQITFERLLISTGLTMYSMISQMTGAIINIIFDPLLIFGIGIFPECGVAGAAYATVLGQCVAACVGLAANLLKNKELKLSIKGILHPVARIVKQIYIVGIPSILMMAIGSVMTCGMNVILGMFNSTAVAVFGVYFKLQSFFFMPVFGLNNGVVPVLAYNLGAARPDRIKESFKFSVLLSFVIMIVGTLIFECVPELLLSVFSASEEMISIGVPALRIIACNFPLAAVSIMMGSCFQAFSKSVYSLVVSVSRQLVVLLPVAWLLAQTGVLSLVWWSFPIAEVVGLIISCISFKKVYGEVVVPLEKMVKSEPA